jgi:hypothetical protein
VPALQQHVSAQPCSRAVQRTTHSDALYLYADHVLCALSS